MNNKNKSLIIKIISVLVIIFLTAAITWQIAVSSFTGDKYLLTKDQFARFSQYQKIDEIINNINKNYYKDSNESDLITGAYEGTVMGLADKYSEYITQEEMESIKRLDSGKFFGIGVTYSIDSQTGYPIIKGTMSGSPAEKAGLKAGDSIIAVDGTDVKGLSSDKLFAKISGEKNTKVNVTISREGKESTHEITRIEVEEEVVFPKVIDGHIGYVRLTQFSGGSGEKVIAAFNNLQKQGCTSFILDVRNNGGGLMSEAVKIADFFMPEGRIVYSKSREGVEEVHDSDKKFFGQPLVILVNNYTASASEIVAGAVQQSGKAKLVGQQTYGKGVVQRVFPLTDGKSWLKLTNSVYYLANNETPNEKGITPDVIVEMDVKNTFDQNNDTQLQKAIALLSK